MLDKNLTLKFKKLYSKGVLYQSYCWESSGMDSQELPQPGNSGVRLAPKSLGYHP